MFDRIAYISEDSLFVNLVPGVEIKSNILSSHVVIEDAEKMLLGEIAELDQERVKIKLLGEFTDGKLFGGILPIGSWGVAEVGFVIFFAILIIAFIYRIKFNDLITSF